MNRNTPNPTKVMHKSIYKISSNQHSGLFVTRSSFEAFSLFLNQYPEANEREPVSVEFIGFSENSYYYPEHEQ